MLALHTIEGTEGGHVELWKQRENKAETSNIKVVLYHRLLKKNGFIFLNVPLKGNAINFTD